MAGDDGTLIKVAVFGITMSIVCTLMITLMFSTSAGGDYDLDEIQSYREEVSSFTGESMLNDTPWVLTGVYTPWYPYMGTDGHVDDGWLYGTSVAYADIGQAADIHLDPDWKSTNPITVGDATYTYDYRDGLKWWADEDAWYGWLSEKVFEPVGQFFGSDKYTYSTGTATCWNYSGYRYVFDPTLPFLNEQGQRETSVVDGSLSIVWYTYNGQEGLSGGLDIYGGDVLLASYSATDIINAYNSTSGYATTYDFDFGGVNLDLSIRFNQEVISNGTPLMQAWSNGDWSMAITSLSAGNFIDMDGSTSFSTTAGGMIKTFVQIYTMSLPDIDNEWMNIVLWLLVGLPMTMSLALITIRIMEAVKPL